MEEQKQEYKDVPYLAHREMMAAQERQVGRLIYVIIFVVVVFVAAIICETSAFIWFLNQYEYTAETVTVDSTDGVANYIGNDGSITNGQSDR